MQLIFGTHNQNKVEEIAKILPSGHIIKSLTDLNFNSEIEESGTTLEENALIKATTIFNIFKKDCFADDTGLMVNALGGRPGVFSARYAGNKKIAKDNTNKLLSELKGVEDRRALFKTVIALILEGNKYLFEGVIKGEISTSPKGQDGFGYDPIFIPEKYELTFAQLTMHEKNKISHRSRAFKKLIEFLKSKNSI